MGKHGFLTELRLRLDDEITYGTRHAAMKLAREGLRESRARGLAGEAEYFKGQIEILKKNFACALEHFDAAIGHNPHDGAAYNDRALCMVEMGIIDDAFAYFDKGIAVEPDFATIHHNKGWLLNNIGRHREALECFGIALKLDRARAVTYDNIADALYNIGDYRGAVQAYEKVLVLLKPGCCRQIRAEVKKRIHQIRKCIS